MAQNPDDDDGPDPYVTDLANQVNDALVSVNAKLARIELDSANGQAREQRLRDELRAAQGEALADKRVLEQRIVELEQKLTHQPSVAPTSTNAKVGRRPDTFTGLPADQGGVPWQDFLLQVCLPQ